MAASLGPGLFIYLAVHSMHMQSDQLTWNLQRAENIADDA